jgi:YYY domain-containing protein
MTNFLSWYLLITLLGCLTFPLAFRLFAALPERGFALSRALGLLVWGYVYWMLGSMGFAQNDLGGILLALAVLSGLSVWALVTHYSSLIDWLQSNLRYLFTVEILFFICFAFLAFVRSANPELTSAEKPMELAFINAILRSPGFPPRDPWLSGYAISYYYFGYIMTAMLAKLTGVPGSLAHNLMTSLIFGLGAIGSYGILYNLLTIQNHNSKFENGGTGIGNPASKIRPQSYAIGSSFFAPLFLLIVSNFEGFLEVLYRRALLPLSFWKWLDMKDLTSAPVQPDGGLWERLGYWWTTEVHAGVSPWLFTWLNKWFSEQFVPERYLWWWRASRVVQDYDLAGNFREVIDEFPFFSFLHADLHPHVLAIPFGLLAIAAALNLFLGGWRGGMKIFGVRLNINSTGFFLSALILGGLAFLNTWDILIAAALIVCAYVLTRAQVDGWRWERLEDFFLLGLPLGFTSILLYLPFYLGFSSQAGGLLPNLINPTRGAHQWVMFGPLLIPLMAWLAYLWRDQKVSANWKLGFFIALGLTLFLWVFSWLLGLLTRLSDPVLVQQFLLSQGTSDLRLFFMEATARRLSYVGSLIVLLAVLIPALAFLLKTDSCPPIHDSPLSPNASNKSRSPRRGEIVVPKSPYVPHSSSPALSHVEGFVLLLIILGALLVLAPEFIYLRDQFGTRLNTVFKFYYQAWILWSLASAFGTATLLQNLRNVWDRAFRIGLGLLLFTGLMYPALSLLTKTNNFNPPFGYGLDDFERLKRENPNEAVALQWLQTAPDGIVAEAVGDSYSGFARVSTYSGLPTVLGWPGHEGQWRGGYAEQGTRREDILTLYTTPNWSIAATIIQKYHIRYVFIGNLERTTLHVQEEKFRLHLHAVFQQGIEVIYEVP